MPSVAEPAIEIRVAGHADLDGLTTLLTAAFEHDPLWSWAFPDPRHLAIWWRLYLGSALRYPNMWIIGDFAAAAVWIPPGGVELTEAEEERVAPLVRELAGARAPAVMELLARFEAAHPEQPPHYYLSLLGTAPACRGWGLGMALLAETLRRIDAERAPAYLESSNPANDRRYQGVGFSAAGAFTTPDGARRVTTMWRAPAAGVAGAV
jgi:GNAT superfamily N-acetyltransferase